MLLNYVGKCNIDFYALFIRLKATLEKASFPPSTYFFKPPTMALPNVLHGKFGSDLLEPVNSPAEPNYPRFRMLSTRMECQEKQCAKEAVVNKP